MTYKKGLDLRDCFELMFSCKVMFNFAVKDKDTEKANYWADSIKFWRNKIRGLQNEN